jgi:hypothetical protein
MSHKETLNKMKAEILKTAGQLVINTNRNQFKKRDVPGLADNPTRYNNFQKLRYHGLIAQARRNGVKLRDEWVITRNGWAFLRGELSLPKYVTVLDNHLVEGGKSKHLVKMLDVLKGGMYLETQFEYFDDEGRPVGIRPMYRNNNLNPMQRGLGI